MDRQVVLVAICVAVLVAFSGCGRSSASPASAVAAAALPVLDERLEIITDGGGDTVLVWNGPVDEAMVLEAVRPVYEWAREGRNRELAAQHENATGRIHYRLYLHPKAAKHEVCYLKISSGDAAHVIPSWSEAKNEFISHRDPNSRPSAKDEDLFHTLQVRLSEISRDFKLHAGESLIDQKRREDDIKLAARRQFAAQHNLTLHELKRLEYRCYLWSWGEKITAERVEEFANPDGEKAEKELVDAKRLIEQGKRRNALKRLKKVVDEYSGSDAADEAVELIRERTDPSNWVTLNQYEAIKQGQSYDKVAESFERDGLLISSSTFGDSTSEVYGWTNGDGSNVHCTFTNGFLEAKVQHGLR